MLDNKEKAKFIDTHFENLLFILRAHLDISEKEALREIEARVKRKLKNL